MTTGDAVLEALTVRPGDTLLVRVSPGRLDGRGFDELAKKLKELKDRVGVEVCLIECEQIAGIRGVGGEDR